MRGVVCDAPVTWWANSNPKFSTRLAFANYSFRVAEFPFKVAFISFFDSCTGRRVVGRGVQGLELQPRPRGRFSGHHRKTGASGVKNTSSPHWTTDSRMTFGRLPDRTALFGAQPRGREPMLRNSRHGAAAPQRTPRLPRRNSRLGLSLNRANTCKGGCSASAARQAVGGSRGAVVKPRTRG